MSRRTVVTALGVLLALVVLAVGVQVWVFPQVAPPVPEAAIAHFERGHTRSVTVLDTGSRREAHRLWARYQDERAVQGVRPRLLGISLVRLRSDIASESGTYWLVALDDVWVPSFAGGTGEYEPCFDFVDPATLRGAWEACG